MPQAHLKHDQPGLSDSQMLLAVVVEALEMARDLEATQSELKMASDEQAQELIASVGLPEEIEDAAKAAHATVLQILSRISKQDLEQGRDQGLLAPDDYTEALKVKRTLSLSRGRSNERDEGRSI